MKKLSLDKKRALVSSKIISSPIELSEEQIDFILHPLQENCHLNACPGSGKTEVVGIKAAYEFSHWNEKNSGLAILSFTKNAAKEITERVKKYGGAQATQYPHFVGTIDSWLHNYILHPFAHKAAGSTGRDKDKSFRLVDNEEQYVFLNSFTTRLSDFGNNFKQAWVNEYYFECTTPEIPISQSRHLNLDGITAEKQEMLRENKKKFLKAGMTTYSDAEFLCFYLLKKNPSILLLLAKRFPIIYIDECQDLSNNQLEILQLLADSGIKLHFIGDTNQSIYEFKRVNVEAIHAFISKNGMTELHLTKNFRSNQKIVNIAMKLEELTTIKPVKQIIGHEAHLFEDCCILLEYDPELPEKIPQLFIDIINEINSALSNSQNHIDINNSVIVARSHNILSLFKNSPASRLTKIELFANALSCWNNVPRTSQDMQNALHQLGKSISMLAYDGNGNHQNQYCPETYTNLEWRAFLYIVITEACLPANNLYPFEDADWSTWAARLKIFLASKWKILLDPQNDWESVKAKVASPKGGATKKVAATINIIKNVHSEKIRMTTFHDVKGETMHAAMVVSSKDKTSKGGHFEHWISKDEKNSEYVRFAYVASSRPKHLLIWAIPKSKPGKNKHLKAIESMGFKLKSNI